MNIQLFLHIFENTKQASERYKKIWLFGNSAMLLVRLFVLIPFILYAGSNSASAQQINNQVKNAPIKGLSFSSKRVADKPVQIAPIQSSVSVEQNQSSKNTRNFRTSPDYDLINLVIQKFEAAKKRKNSDLENQAGRKKHSRVKNFERISAAFGAALPPMLREQIKLLRRKAHQYLARNNYTRGLQIYDAAIKALMFNNSLNTVYGHFLLVSSASIALDGNEASKSAEYLEAAENIEAKISDSSLNSGQISFRMNLQMYAYEKLEKFVEATKVGSELVELLEESNNKNNQYLAKARIHLAKLYFEANNPAEAIIEGEIALNEIKPLFAENSTEYFNTRITLAKAYEKEKNWLKASENYQAAAQIEEQSNGAAYNNTLKLFLDFVKNLYLAGKRFEAEDLAAIHINKIKPLIKSREKDTNYFLLTDLAAESANRKNQLDNAIALWREAIPGIRKEFGEFSLRYYSTVGKIALAEEKKGDLIAASNGYLYIIDTEDSKLPRNSGIKRAAFLQYDKITKSREFAEAGGEVRVKTQFCINCKSDFSDTSFNYFIE